MENCVLAININKKQDSCSDIVIYKHGHKYTHMHMISAQKNITSIQTFTQ